MSGKAYRNPGAIAPMGRNARRKLAWSTVDLARNWNRADRAAARFHLAQLVRP